MKAFTRIAAAFAIAFSLGACSTEGILTTGGDIFASSSASTATPADVTTLTNADNAAATIVTLAQTAVDTGKLTVDQLKGLQAARASVRAALDSLHADNAAGKPLDYSLFNAAVRGFYAYKAKQGL